MSGAQEPHEGPRLEVLKHREAESRLRVALLNGQDYPGKDEDLELVRRKQRELDPERLRRVLGGGA